MGSRLLNPTNPVRTWKGGRDRDGNREYTLRTMCITDSIDDGPATVMQTPGLPLMGSTWAFGNDIDLWAWCRPDMTVSIHQEKEGDGGVIWAVDQKFSTVPPDKQSNENRTGQGGGACYDAAAQDPLSEPDRISGSFFKERREGHFASVAYYQGDTLLNGPFLDHPITNSAFEPIRGPENEWDELMPQVVIEMNVPLLQFDLLSQYKRHVNDTPMWGQEARCIKLSNITWTRQFYQQCYMYFVRTLTFDIDPETFDRTIVDEGSSFLRGSWSSANPPVYTPASGADPRDPSQFVRAEDRHGAPKRFILNGNGEPVTDPDDAGSIYVEYYQEADFLELGIPPEF